MAAVGLAMLRPPRADAPAEQPLSRQHPPRLGLTGLGVGGGAGFFGIGGGFLIVPGLMSATGLSLAAAQASSLVSVAAFGASTAANYSLSGLIDWNLVAAMTVGGAAGTLLAMPIAVRLGQNAALGRRLFAGLILIVAVYVADRAWMAL